MEIQKKIGLSIALGFLIILSFGCHKKSNMGYSESKGFVEKDFDCSNNESKDYLLCQKAIPVGKKGIESIKYYIIDNNGSVIVEGTIENGSVKWEADYVIEIFETPGNISTELSKDDITKVFLVKEKSFMSKSEYLKQKD